MLSRIGTGELLVILLVALFVVGPERLPKLAKAVGKAVAGFKRYMNDVTGDLKESSEDFKSIADEMTKVKDDLTKTVRKTAIDIESAPTKAAPKASGEKRDEKTSAAKVTEKTQGAPVEEPAREQEVKTADEATKEE